MELTKKITALLLSAAALSTAIPVSTCADESEMPELISDINDDHALTVQDMVLMSKYLLGSGELEEEAFSRADSNADGSVDTFDLANMRHSYIYNASHTPAGKWEGTGFNGERVFQFDDSETGSVSIPARNVTIPFTIRTNGSKITFALSGGAPASAVISWIDSEHFYLEWDGSKSEYFTYSGNHTIVDTGLELNGNYISNLGDTYSFEKNAGKCNGGPVTVVSKNKEIKFIYGNGTSQTGVYSPVDKYHFTIIWNDGTVEKFTRREIKTSNGLTYVNGILIANKTYSVPQSYDPGGLTGEFMAAYNEMIADAYADGITLWVCSGYRSYSYQSKLYNNYVYTDGKAAADTYSARPGHSEHQTGLAADINSADESFAGTPEAKWLAANCWKYGFIIRYPKGKESITGYIYEPWHIRYLGKENAKLVYESGLTLEEYLGIDSVYSY